MKKWLFGILVLMLGIQLFVPAYMIYEKLDIINTGKEFKMKVRPVDPYDAFRGRYVNISPSFISFENNVKIEGSSAFGVIKTDENGFMSFEKVETEKPKEADFITLKVEYGYWRFPADRYYMDEKLEPLADKVLSGRNQKEAFVTVKVKNGKVVFTGLYVDNMKIEEYLSKTD